MGCRLLALTLGLCLLVVPGVAAAQETERVRDLLLDQVDGFRLSPEGDGITGPLTARDLAEFAGEPMPDLGGVELAGYMRGWFDPTGSSVVAVGLSMSDRGFARGARAGLLDTLDQQGLERATITSVDGAIGAVGTQFGMATRVAVIPSGSDIYVLTVSGDAAETPDLVEAVAAAQAARLPAGVTAPSDSSPFYDVGYRIGQVLGGLVLVALIAGLVLFLIRRRRPRPAPPAAQPAWTPAPPAPYAPPTGAAPPPPPPATQGWAPPASSAPPPPPRQTASSAPRPAAPARPAGPARPAAPARPAGDRPDGGFFTAG